MNNNQIAPHEILELHELMNTNILSAKKISVSLAMVKDNNLKNIMQNLLNGKKGRLQELQNFINSQIGSQSTNGNSNQSQ